DAQDCRDEAFVWLPGYVEALEILPENAAAWQRAVETALQLRRELDAMPANLDDRQNSIDVLIRLTGDLRKDPKSLHALRRPLEPERLKAILARRGTARGADGKEGRALLATAWLSADQRAELWSSYRRVAAARHAESLARLDASPDRPVTPLPAWD